MPKLRPFIRYYGGKFRAAPHYPAPRHGTVIEPFAGAAGYALRYHNHKIILVEKYPVLAEMWRYLIAVSPAEILQIPEVEHVDDLPDWVPAGGRTLVGFAMNGACVSPCKRLSAGRKKLRAAGRKYEGWSEAHRACVARQVPLIRHWTVIEGGYDAAPDIAATWFVDPPYSNSAGSYYVHGSKALDYAALGDWCRTRRGQVIVCENDGADWLPFRFFGAIKAMAVKGKRYSQEAIWTDALTTMLE